MISLRDRLVLAFSLAALFGAGVVAGYQLGSRAAIGRLESAEFRPFVDKKVSSCQHSPASSPESDVASSPAEWWTRSLARLGSDLQLSEAQKRIIESMLQDAGAKMFRSRDRALFSIHLELLQFHEALARAPGLLDAGQTARLTALRIRLRHIIESQFPQFLKDTPLPAVPATALDKPGLGSGFKGGVRILPGDGLAHFTSRQFNR